MKLTSVIIFLGVLIAGSILFCNRVPLMWYKKVKITQNIIEKEISINLSKHQRPERISMNLIDQNRCDIDLEFYYLIGDSLLHKRSIPISNLKNNQYIMDYYSKNLVVKVANPEGLECEKLTVELTFRYWIDF